MTNAEFYTKKEVLADLAIVLLQDCDCQQSKINTGLWLELVKLYKEIEEYI